MEEAKPKVYISIGSNSSTKEKRAADIIFRALETAGLSPRQMGRNKWSAVQPLRAIKGVIEECSGIVVIAFRRYSFPSGTERQKSGEDKQLTDVRLTTVWNQIEAALGYSKNLPLLVIAENGLLEDGLLEGRYDWVVYWTDFSPENFESDAFAGYLDSWKELVLDHSKKQSENGSEPGADDPGKRPLRKLLGELTVPELWGVLSAFVGLLAAVATAAFKLGQHFH